MILDLDLGWVESRPSAELARGCAQGDLGGRVVAEKAIAGLVVSCRLREKTTASDSLQNVEVAETRRYLYRRDPSRARTAGQMIADLRPGSLQVNSVVGGTMLKVKHW